MNETEGDIAFRCAFAFVDQLVQSGMEHVCASPGSRSTPMVLALARHPGVRVHVHLDERSSAFFALGIAKVTHRAVAVVTTSGTAAAELFPAVVEASMSRTPLLLLTADRPPELQGVGANQTIDQTELYGAYVRAFVGAPVPGDDPDERGWRTIATGAYRSSLAPMSGPVHVNVPFRDPLVPRIDAPERFEGRGTTVAAVRTEPFDDVSTLLGEVERGVILAGSLRGQASEVTDLAHRLRWPLIAEPTSGLRTPGALAAGQFLLSNEAFIARHTPALVLQFGAAPTSRVGLELVGRGGRLVIVDPDRLVADPHRMAERTVTASAANFAAAVIDALPLRPETPWVQAWLEGDERTRAVVDALLDDLDEPFEGRIARDLAASLRDGSALVVGSSMPVRDLDAYMAPREGLRVLANRGASGIDGFVSTALGVAASGVPTSALCGDLTLLHDVGSLVWSARRGHDAVFVVPNNDGGAIFSFLPQRELPEFEELFVTPHGLDLSAICAAAGAGHAVVERADDLVPAVERARAAGGVHVVEVPTDRERNVQLHAQVHAAVDAAVRSAG